MYKYSKIQVSTPLTPVPHIRMHIHLDFTTNPLSLTDKLGQVSHIVEAACILRYIMFKSSFIAGLLMLW